VCCSALQCIAACCSVLQCVAVCCSVRQCVAARCSVMEDVDTGMSNSKKTYLYCSVLQCDAVSVLLSVCCSELQCAAVSVLQSVCCSELQCAAVSVLQSMCYSVVQNLDTGMCSSAKSRETSPVTVRKSQLYTDVTQPIYRVAKTHRMPYLYLSL